MIKKLRARFIRIATFSAAAVLLLLCLIVNIAHFATVNGDLTDMLSLIAQNQGRVPGSPAEEPGENGNIPPNTPGTDVPGNAGDSPADGAQAPGAADGTQVPGGSAAGGAPTGEPGDKAPGTPGDNKKHHLNAETPFSTRYFVLRYTADGALISADLRNIAAVTENDTDKYLETALRHGEGYGFTGGYKYLVTTTDDGNRMAVFLDDHTELHSVAVLGILSAVSLVGCVLLVYVAMVLCSRRAIDPVIRTAEKQKQFITDASHELKTPITVIFASLSVLEMEVGKQKWIDKARGQTEKLTELVEELVTLSRLDEEQPPLHFADFAISDVAGEVAESFRDFAAAKGHELQLGIEPGVTYHGDEYAIRRLISVLLDNAVKYAAPGAPILFSLSKNKKGVTLCEKNAFEGKFPEHPELLFDRFYRADPARTEKGFGIGLSIARAITEAHKSKITAAAENGNTAVFTVQLK